MITVNNKDNNSNDNNNNNNVIKTCVDFLEGANDMKCIRKLCVYFVLRL